MKAKDYFEKFDKRYSEVLRAMFEEVEEIRKIRQARTNEALVSIFKEIDKKWRAYVRLPEIKELGLRPDAFIDVCVDSMPLLAHYFPEAFKRVILINAVIEERRKNELRS